MSIALRAGALLVTLLVVAYGYICWSSERSLVHPPHQAVGQPPSSLGIAYREVAFESSDGIHLRGWWVPGSGPASVVLLHGYAATRSDAWDKAGAWLHAAGYNVLAFDFRGSGLSSGDTVTIGHDEPKDAAAAIDFAEAHAAGPLAVMGFSMGAGVAVIIGAERGDVRAVVEDSGWTTLQAVIDSSFSQFAHLPAAPFEGPIVTYGQLDVGFKATDVRPVDAAPHLQQPLLAIIGDRDATIPPAQGREVYSRAPQPKQLLEVPNAGHTEAHQVAPALYERTVLSFLATYLTVTK